MDKYPVWLKLFVNTVFEETLFRYTLITLFILFIDFRLAILLSSIIYGLVHRIYFDLNMVVITFILGIVLGIVYYVFHFSLLGLWICIMIHYFVVMIGYWFNLYRYFVRR